MLYLQKALCDSSPVVKRRSLWMVQIFLISMTLYQVIFKCSSVFRYTFPSFSVCRVHQIAKVTFEVQGQWLIGLMIIYLQKILGNGIITNTWWSKVKLLHFSVWKIQCSILSVFYACNWVKRTSHWHLGIVTSFPFESDICLKIIHRMRSQWRSRHWPSLIFWPILTI